VSSTHTRKLNSVIDRILHAEPWEEPDRAIIKWPKQKFKRPKDRTEFVPKKRKRVSKSLRNRRRLHESGRDMKHCEDCRDSNNIQIHHKDGNPNNNSLDNLLVLCKNCHVNRHKIADLVGVKEWYVGTIQDERVL